VLGLGAEWLARSGQSVAAAAADLAVGWVLIACGLIAISRRPQSRIGILLAATGFAWFLGTLGESDIAGIAAFGAATLTVYRGPLFHSILVYPSGRALDGLEIGVVTVGYLSAVIVPMGRSAAATLVVTLLVVATTNRGYLMTAGPERQARARGVAAALAVAVVLGGESIMRLSETSPEPGRPDPWLWGLDAVLVLIGVGFLADLSRGRWAQAAVTKLVVDLGERTESGTLRSRLAHALGDRSLQIAYWLPDANGYVDERGDPIVLPRSGSGRAVTMIERYDERIGALVHDGAALDDPGLVDAVAAAAGIAVSNVRLHAEVRSQVAELAASRRRILEAGDAQRRRLQQELGEGAERRLDSVRALLGSARREAGSAGEREAAERLEEAERELAEAQMELRELADGIHPTLLTQGGLVALSLLAERAPGSVNVTVPPGRFPPALESAVYFVCSEALANVAKYAAASRVIIRVTRPPGLLVVEISDDGIGGADPVAGSGLRGQADRVEALGGRLVFESPLGMGTRILAEIPCESDP
jgi:signal transduction histidine kinase